MAIELLSAGKVDAEIKRKVKTEKMLHDGGGLYLQVARSGSVSWILRFKSPVTSKMRDMGLGAAHKLPLAKAREAAKRLREAVHAGRDPIVERDNAKAKAGSAATFRQRFDFMMEQHERPGWRRLLELHAFPAIGDKLISAIGTDDIIGIIGALLKKKQFETARKVQQRIQAVMKSATNSIDTVAHKQYVCNTLPTFKKVRKNKPFSAIHYTQLPEFFADLQRGPDVKNERHAQGVAYLALQFVILTVCRTGDIVGARRKEWAHKQPMRWRDVDLKRKVWTVPAVKTADSDDPKPFEIPLSNAAIDVLMRLQARGMSGCRPDDWVFPSDFRTTSRAKPMAVTAMQHIMLRDKQSGGSVHGMRSAFRGYVSNVLHVDKEVIETTLAHRIFSTDKAEAAYKDQVTLFDKRRDLMDRWAAYVTGKQVIKLSRHRAAA
jgi:integrase